jgi:hypothetical protein
VTTPTSREQEFASAVPQRRREARPRLASARAANRSSGRAPGCSSRSRSATSSSRPGSPGHPADRACSRSTSRRTACRGYRMRPATIVGGQPRLNAPLRRRR